MARPIRSAIAFLLGIALALCAQADDAPHRELDFAVLPLDSALAETTLFYTEDGASDVAQAVELSLNPRERSRYYHYSGPNPMPVFRQETDEGGVIQLMPVYQINFTDDGNRWLVLLEDARPETPPPYRNHTFRYDQAAFPEGSLLFFNATGVRFYGVLGRNRLELAPGSNPAIDVRPYYDVEATLGLAVQDGDHPRKVLESKISFHPERRTLIILRPPNRAGSYRIQAQRISEYLGEFDPDDPGA